MFKNASKWQKKDDGAENVHTGGYCVHITVLLCATDRKLLISGWKI